MERGQRTFTASAVHQVPSAENNQYANEAYFDVACSELLQIFHFNAIEKFYIPQSRERIIRGGFLKQIF